jgi:hypothetical protein
MAFTIFLTTILLFYILLLRLKTRSRRDAAAFALYDARDKFVLLVAKGLISESDPVFSYYYFRINAILSAAPNIGLEHVIHSLLKSKSDDLEKAIRSAKENAKKVHKSKSMELPEVKDAVKCYFDASREMILSHSNFLNFFYVYYKNHHVVYKLLNGVIVPKAYDQAARVVSNYNDDALDCLA